MQKIEPFLDELNLIQDSINREFIADCLNAAPDYFFKIPASSTGKYHPLYCLGEGGLARHTKAAVKIANDLLRLDMYKELLPDRDAIIGALILHDTCKNGRGLSSQSWTLSKHPVIASEMVREIFNENAAAQCGPSVEYADTVRALIETHMGQWREDYRTKQIVLPAMETPAQKFVHLCDYLASRKFLIVDLDEKGS